jgi:hypothetical protein
MESKSFKIWNRDNSIPKVEKKNYASIRKDRVVFLRDTIKQMKLHEGMEMAFLQDADNPKLLFMARIEQNGLKVEYCKPDNCLFIKAPLMCAELFHIVGAQRAFRVRISSVPEAFPKSPGLPPAGYRIYLNEVKLK